MITTDESGNITIDGEHIRLAELLRAQSALSLEVTTSMRASARYSSMLVAAHYCGSSKRTKAGVWIDYVVWLASYGIEVNSIDRVRPHLSTAQGELLDKQLRIAAAAFAERKEAQRLREIKRDADLSALMDSLKPVH